MLLSLLHLMKLKLSFLTHILTAGKEQGADSNTLNPKACAVFPRSKAQDKEGLPLRIQKPKQLVSDFIMINSFVLILVIWTLWPQNFLVSVFAGQCSENFS